MQDNYRDLKNVTDTAREEGVEEGFEQGLEQGLEQGIEAVARNMLKAGLTASQIAQFTGLSEARVKMLM